MNCLMERPAYPGTDKLCFLLALATFAGRGLGGFECGDDRGRDTTPVGHLVAVLLGPFPDGLGLLAVTAAAGRTNGGGSPSRRVVGNCWGKCKSPFGQTSDGAQCVSKKLCRHLSIPWPCGNCYWLATAILASRCGVGQRTFHTQPACSNHLISRAEMSTGHAAHRAGRRSDRRGA